MDQDDKRDLLAPGKRLILYTAEDMATAYSKGLSQAVEICHGYLDGHEHDVGATACLDLIEDHLKELTSVSEFFPDPPGPPS